MCSTCSVLTNIEAHNDKIMIDNFHSTVFIQMNRLSAANDGNAQLALFVTPYCEMTQLLG